MRHCFLRLIGGLGGICIHRFGGICVHEICDDSEGPKAGCVRTRGSKGCFYLVF